jgi:hypothetical protein
MAQLLKNKKKIVLVNVKNSVDHYTQLFKKYSIQIPNYFATKQFQAINCLDLSGKLHNPQQIAAEENVEELAEKLFRSNNNSVNNPLYESLYKEIMSIGNDYSIIIDDLNALSLLSTSANEMDFYNFLMYLKAHIDTHNTPQNINSLLLVNHNDVEGQCRRIFETFLSSANLRINLTPLKTGHSNDIDGLMQINRLDQMTGIDNYEYNLHYKLTETSVQLFTRGHAI